MLEGLFSFLFKYRPSLFARGELVFRPPVSATLLLVVGALLGLLVAWSYARAPGKAGRGGRLTLAGLRLAILALVLVALLRPELILTSVVPQRNYVGILIDDSRSMRLDDAGGQTRGERAQAAFTAASSPVVRALRDRFRLRYFRFSDQAHRFEPGTPLVFAGGVTRIAGALQGARADLGALPLSGLVLVTDGADNGETGMTETLLSLKATGVPVFTVGAGAERFARDIELERVNVPRTALRGSALQVDLLVSQTGFGGRTVPLQVEDGGQIIASQQVTLPREGEPGTVRVTFTLDEAGPRLVTFRIPLQDGEQVAENNVQEALIVVRSGKQKILYFEGEPRWEVKFLRRAVEHDSSLQVVLLQRMGNDRFLRLDVDSAGELFGGFPRTREELFRYRALILGSVEAGFFTRDQLQMIADFVSERGGGLLVLGGRHALAEGGYAGTPVADALPVTLDARYARDSSFVDELKVSATPAGLAHPALRIMPDSVDPAQRWQALPPLTTVNHVGALKPGATALLQGAGSTGDEPVLAYQRFGRGLALVLPVENTWRWQMDTSMPLTDQTHELFWRQLLRWLVSDVPDRLLVTVPDRASPGEPVRISARVSDSRFVAVNDDRVRALVTTPSGDTLGTPLDWTLERDGEYRGSFTPAAAGRYEIQVSARRDSALTTSEPTYVQVGESRAEYFNAQRRTPLLRRIAQETGGRYYDVGSLADLPDDLAHAGHGVTVPEERDLWNMPALLLLLIGLLAAEWTLRRRREMS